MSLLTQALHRPQRVWLRRALFQIHLWTGIGTGLYVLVISISGSAIVFQEEMEHALYSHIMQVSDDTRPQANVEAVIQSAQASYPGYRVESVFMPSEDIQTFGIELRTEEARVVAYAHPVTARILGHRERDRPFLEWMNDLHHNLLAGDTGRLVNGIGGIFLTVLCLTGIVVWWPGIKNWRRVITVDVGRTWKRVNWDLHSATGFWMLILIALWAVTGAYYTWDDELDRAINYVSPVSSLTEPESNVAMKGSLREPELAELIERAQKESPHTRLSRISFPDDDQETIRVMMARGEIRDRRNTDDFYFDQFTGDLLHTWQRGVHRSAGDAIVYWIDPLHFGHFGGVGVKILWVILGLTPAVLFVTGSLMWWNRVLSKKWARLKAETTPPRVKRSEGLLKGSAIKVTTEDLG